ncbi:transferase 2, rSAM/selenodomain-associated [Hathewaya proteolytica DSM 3090]|uniref:4,4'-diaponeurosporenoate glycosyltransferase n=1 Tax=Hathewaya proteolytica DSM 3090 TaxID=1121331 RepID=A0A1M6KHG6_9CLOT|nr:TIGR04283 family arsenosugar biosynthesis glycosyltransferase [Hathewaya proteolytica]SHJ58332.1 transferase 2, rSAM/selenodomain-associated [Hathewaya proteolytica DSM 3090]
MDIKEKNKISIIIPVYNEAKTINELLHNIEQFKAYSEIIFVDGGSNDGTNKIIEKYHRLVYSPKKGRSYQMNYGATLAKGKILLFLHADSYLSHDALDKINVIMSQGHKVGCFKIKFNSKSPIMKICGFMSNLRVRLRNIAFGDQGIFIERNFFYKLGGFAEIPLMEDYQLSIDIKKTGEKIVVANSIIETSARRFIKQGRLKTMIKMQKAQHMYRKGVDIDKIVDLYKP